MFRTKRTIWDYFTLLDKAFFVVHRTTNPRNVLKTPRYEFTSDFHGEFNPSCTKGSSFWLTFFYFFMFCSRISTGKIPLFVTWYIFFTLHRKICLCENSLRRRHKIRVFSLGMKLRHPLKISPIQKSNLNNHRTWLGIPSLTTICK